jgi:hypothetical protein
MPYTAGTLGEMPLKSIHDKERIISFDFSNRFLTETRRIEYNYVWIFIQGVFYMDSSRAMALQNLEEKRNSKVILYATSDRRNLEANIAVDILPFFVNHLDKIGDIEKISLVLYTRGGETLAAWSLVNLIRNFCKDFEVIVPFHCHSAGTLICLGATVLL